MVSRKPQEDNRPQWYPSNNDVAELKQKLEAYKQIRINGKLQTKFDQHCKTIGVLYFDEYGDRVITQPNDYRVLSQIYHRLKSQEDAAGLAYLEKHPEERKKMLVKLQEMRKSFGFV